MRDILMYEVVPINFINNNLGLFWVACLIFTFVTLVFLYRLMEDGEGSGFAAFLFTPFIVLAFWMLLSAPVLVTLLAVASVLIGLLFAYCVKPKGKGEI